MLIDIDIVGNMWFVMFHPVTPTVCGQLEQRPAGLCSERREEEPGLEPLARGR